MSDRTLTRYGYIIKKKNLSDSEQQAIRKDLTIYPVVLPAFQSLGSKPVPFKIYLETEHRFYLPRYYGLEKYGLPKIMQIAAGDKIDLQCTYDLLPHQVDAWQAMRNHFEAGHSGIMSMFCGGGKTSLAIRLACHLKSKTLVVVNKEVLLDQWKDRISQFTGNRARIGVIQRNLVQYQDKDFVIAMLHSLSMKEYPPEVFTGFDLTIVDECHHIAASTFSKALPKIATRYMLGLSATPDRRDGLSKVFYNYLGPLFHSQRRQGCNQVIVKSIHIRSTSPAYRMEFLANGTKNTGAMVTNVGTFYQRNVLIVQILGILAQQGRKILVLSGRREQLEFLEQALGQEKFQYQGNPVTYGLYYGFDGGSKQGHRAMLESSTEAQIILGTTNIAQEGLDIPALNTLVLISSLTDVEQASGRILRKYHENLNPLIIDLVDGTGNFPKHFKMREAYYKEESYSLESLRIEFDDSDGSLDNVLPKVRQFLSVCGKGAVKFLPKLNSTIEMNRALTDNADEISDEETRLEGNTIKILLKEPITAVSAGTTGASILDRVPTKPKVIPATTLRKSSVTIKAKPVAPLAQTILSDKQCLLD